MDEHLDSSDCLTDIDNTDDDNANPVNEDKNDLENTKVNEVGISLDQTGKLMSELEDTFQISQTTLANKIQSWCESQDQSTLIEKLRKEKKQLQDNLSRYTVYYV